MKKGKMSRIKRDKRTVPLFLALVMVFMLAFAACSDKQVQEDIPEIGFLEYQGQQCPVLNVADEDKAVDIINAEIEAQFQRLYDSSGGGNIKTFTSSKGTMLSILLFAENEVSYGTDGDVWSICYDYSNKIIVPCGAYLSRIERSYSDICKQVEAMLREGSKYEYISVPYFYFDSNANPILVVAALEHPIGADPWLRIYHYDLSSNSFVNSPWTT